MRASTKVQGGLVALLVILGVVHFTPQPASSKASATVYVDTGEGRHGSGVHIGDGYVITAAHVIEGRDNLEVKDTFGAAHSVVRLWSNKEYDIALLRVSDAQGLKWRRLQCRIPTTGENLRLEGNPLDLKDFATFARVSQSRPISVKGMWSQALHVDGVVPPGMSGGPAISESGYVVGINVGHIDQYGIGIIVPAKTVCELLAR